MRPSRLFVLVPLLGLVPRSAPARGPAGALAALTADRARIERVYHDHRLWPKENPGARPDFAAVLPAAAIAERTARGLAYEAALAEDYGVVLTPALVQGEFDRTVLASRDPAMLRELFAALDDDPARIAAALIRPLLAERLLAERYAQDGARHAPARTAARAALARADWRDLPDFRRWSLIRRPAGAVARPGPEADAFEFEEADFAARVAALPAPGAPPQWREDGEGIALTRVLRATRGRVELESVLFRKLPFPTWWAERSRALAPDAAERALADAPAAAYRLPEFPAAPAGCRVWAGSHLTTPPAGRIGHSAVWTGSEMIIWGGQNTPDGARYTPSTDSWVRVATLNAPSGRQWHAAVWTGSEMIVWGGYSGGLVSTGARYNPLTDAWTTMTTGGAPTGRVNMTAVWTGSQMVVWGGDFNSAGETNTGGRYSPAGNSWQATSTGANVPSARTAHRAVWTGSVMVVWGGRGGSAETNTGGRYSPSTDSWQTVSTGAGVPQARYGHAMVWTGGEAIVWGGFGASNWLNTGARYNPNTNGWVALPVNGTTPGVQSNMVAAWTGSEMIVYGGLGESGVTGQGARYNPTSGNWVPLPALNSPGPREFHTGVWTGAEFIVWGGTDFSNPESSVGGRYSPATDAWTPTYGGALTPVARTSHAAVWTGSEMIVWGGYVLASPYRTQTGGRYDPALDAWRATAIDANTPAPRALFTGVWSGARMIVWGGSTDGATQTDTGGRYDPGLDAWQTTRVGLNTPQQRMWHAAVWSGSRMIVWGGFDTALLATGGRYDPVADTWQAVATAGAPTARYVPLAAWVGSRMVVWGGGESAGFTNTGGRYDPVGDAWLGMTTTNAPSPRQNTAAAASPTLFMVWGGNGPLDTGGRYDPALDVWNATLQGTGSPPAREYHNVVWGGNELLVWGGTGSTSQPVQPGGRYNPVSNTWLYLEAAGGPQPRREASALWTGSMLLVWGGWEGSVYHDDGGAWTVTAPQSPGTSLRAAKSGSNLNFSWASAAGATFYDVRRCDALTGPCTPASIVATVTSPAYSEATNTTSRFYTATAVNPCGSTP